MKAFKWVFCVLAVLYFSGACKKSRGPEPPSITVTTTTLNVSSEAGKTIIQVASNTGWAITGLPEWLNVTPDKGHGDAAIAITFSSNTGTVAREAILLLRAEGLNDIPVTVLQAGQAPPPVTITSFMTHGKGGDLITIRGTGFLPTVTGNKVFIAGKPAEVVAASDTKLEVKVPMKAGNGKIMVRVGNEAATSSTDFVYDWQWWVEDLVTVPGFMPFGIAMDSHGNAFIADRSGHKIWKITISAGGTAGLAVYAGDGMEGSRDGQGQNAGFYYPFNVTIDAEDNLYVLEGTSITGHIRKIAPDGHVTTIKDAAGVPIVINDWEFSDITVDEQGTLFLTHYKSDKVMRIIRGQSMTEYATDGTLSALLDPQGVAVDRNGHLYVANAGGQSIATIIPSYTGTGAPSVFAGRMSNPGSEDGNDLTARFRYPTDVAIDAIGKVYVADQGNHRIRMIERNETGAIHTTTLAGSSAGDVTGPATSAKLEQPAAIAVNKEGKLIYFVQTGRNRKIKQLFVQ